MKKPSSQNGKEFACVYDRKQKCWLSFSEPVHIVEIYKTANLLSALEKIENACRTDKLFAVGFVAYDATPAFDAAMQCRRAPDFPLLWFGLFPAPRKTETLPLSIAAQTPPRFDYNWSPTVSENEYNAAIKRVKDYIEHGQTYQVNYSFRLRTRIDEQPEALFHRMISSQGFGYGAFLQTRQWTVCSASPELFFAKDDAHLKMRPMKGTASRGLTREDDLRNADWLRNSEKNRAENLMIVDMVRHDLGHIADPGSVKVDKIFEVEQYPTVWQMTSTVECRTTAGFPDIFRALFPAASITGAPKIRTMEIIRELETTPRKLYTGTVGFCDPDGRCQFNVAIRTAVTNNQSRETEYGVGGGIVWDSTEAGEYEECRTKAKVLTHPPPPLQLLETIMWNPDDKLFLLERHLNRLQQSAAYFEFSYDHEEIVQYLNNAAAECGGQPAKIRLLLNRKGDVSVESMPLAKLPKSAAPVKLELAANPIDSNNPFLYHKTTNRTVYDQAKAAASKECDDVLLWNDRDEVTESCIANIVIDIGGDLLTPPVECGLLPGTFREMLLEENIVQEHPVRVEDLKNARRVYLINSVRNWRRAILLF